MPYPFAPIMLLAALVLGLTVGRLITLHGWRQMQRHACGHLELSPWAADYPCEACGVTDKEWTKVTARERFPFGHKIRSEA